MLLMDHANTKKVWSEEGMKQSALSSSSFVPDGSASAMNSPMDSPSSSSHDLRSTGTADDHNNNNSQFLDYAHRPIPEGVTLTKYRGGITTHFPALLHAMLSRADSDGYGHIVNWMDHGRAFAVYDRRGFVEVVMPKFFRQTQFASFQRQLNLYGFQRLSVSGANVRRQQQQQPSSNHHGAYYHAMFLRKRHDLCPAIQRATEKELREQKLAHNKGKSSTSAAAAEPNLYALPPMPALDPQDVLQAESVTNTLQRKAPKNNSSNNKAGNNFLSTEILPLATSSNPAKAVLGVPHQQNPMAAASSSAVFSPQDWLTGGGAPLHSTSLKGNFSNNTTASSFANNASSSTAVNNAYDSLFLGDDLCQPQLLPQPPASNLMEDMSWLEPTPLPEDPLSVPSQQVPSRQVSSSKAMAKRSRSPSMANFLNDVDFSDNDDGDVAPPPNKMLASFDAQPLAPPPAVALCPPARHMPSSSMMNMHNRKTNIKMPRCFADITTYSRAALVTKANSPFTIVYVNPLMMKALDESRSSDPSYFCGKSMQAFCSSEVTQLMSAAYCAKTMQAVQGNVAVQLIGSTDFHQAQLYEATVGPFFMSQDRQQIGNTEYLVWNFERRGVEMV